MFRMSFQPFVASTLDARKKRHGHGPQTNNPPQKSKYWTPSTPQAPSKTSTIPPIARTVMYNDLFRRWWKGSMRTRRTKTGGPLPRFTFAPAAPQRVLQTVTVRVAPRGWNAGIYGLSHLVEGALRSRCLRLEVLHHIVIAALQLLKRQDGPKA